jgi:DNA-binding CsgD family transcriptional regulator
MEDDLAALIRFLLSPPAGEELDGWRATVADRVAALTGSSEVDFSFEGCGPTGRPERAERDGDAETEVSLVVRGGADGDAALVLRFPPGGPRMEESTLLVEVLRPVVRAALRRRRELRAHRSDALRLLRATQLPALLCDHAGDPVRANDALARSLDGPDGAALWGRMERLARLSAHRPADIPEPRTGDGLRVLHLHEPSGQVEADILVTAAPTATAPPSEASARFGLTPRQTETALLLAAGHSNAKIAAQLGISLFTVQKHVRQVLAKLGVHSRAAAAAALRGAPHERN